MRLTHVIEFLGFTLAFQTFYVDYLYFTFYYYFSPQISNSISNSVRKLSSKVKIEVIVLKAEYELIGALVSTVDLNCPDNNSFTSLCKK